MIVCLSASHKRASLPLLESLKIQDEEGFMKDLCSGLARECVLLQTCHRVEVYVVAEDSNEDSAVDEVLRSWSIRTGISLDILRKTVEVHFGGEALKHLFHLTSGLESMVLGEDQILGQVRSAYVKARRVGTAGLILGKAFMKAVNVGRRVRTETAINERPVSISSVAVDLAERELGDLSLSKALVIGAGEAGSIVAETLSKRGVKEIFVANRTFEKGLELASRVGGDAVKFDEIPHLLPRVDLVFAAVSVDEPIWNAEQVKEVLAEPRSKKELYIIDISQPRAFEEKVGLLQGVTLRNIDDLKAVVEENLRARRLESEKAEKIVHEELLRFKRQLSKLFVEPMISEIWRRVEEIRRRELDRAVRKMGESDERKLMILDRFSRELVERVLQAPIERLREAALEDDGSLLSAAEEIFGIKARRCERVVKI